jgi:hypothetical protein
METRRSSKSKRKVDNQKDSKEECSLDYPLMKMKSLDLAISKSGHEVLQSCTEEKNEKLKRKSYDDNDSNMPKKIKQNEFNLKNKNIRDERKNALLKKSYFEKTKEHILKINESLKKTEVKVLCNRPICDKSFKESAFEKGKEHIMKINRPISDKSFKESAIEKGKEHIMKIKRPINNKSFKESATEKTKERVKCLNAFGCKNLKNNEIKFDSKSFKTNAVLKTKDHVENLKNSHRSKISNDENISLSTDEDVKDLHWNMKNVPTSDQLKNHDTDPGILKAVMLLWKSLDEANRRI